MSSGSPLRFAAGALLVILLLAAGSLLVTMAS